MENIFELTEKFDIVIKKVAEEMVKVLDSKDIDETLNGGVVSAVVKDITYSLTYHDCKAIVEYDTKTNEIIKLEQYMNLMLNCSMFVLCLWRLHCFQLSNR